MGSIESKPNANDIILLSTDENSEDNLNNDYNSDYEGEDDGYDDDMEPDDSIFKTLDDSDDDSILNSED